MKPVGTLIEQLPLFHGFVSRLERTAGYHDGDFVTWDNVDRLLPPDKKTADDLPFYLEARRGSDFARRPPIRGAAYGLLAEGFQLRIRASQRAKPARRSEPEPERKHTPAPARRSEPEPVVFSRHDANVADGYYTALRGGDIELAIERGLDRGGYEPREVARCVSDGMSAADRRLKVCREFILRQTDWRGKLADTLSLILAYGRSGCLWSAQRHLAQALGVDRSTISRRIKALAAGGALSKIGEMPVGNEFRAWHKDTAGQCQRWKSDFELRVNLYQISALFSSLFEMHTNAISRSIFCDNIESIQRATSTDDTGTPIVSNRKRRR